MMSMFIFFQHIGIVPTKISIALIVKRFILRVSETPERRALQKDQGNL